MDNLAYTYDDHSNRLLSVSDSSGSTEGFNDGNTSGDDYTYDSFGNMIEDKNKDITQITYNHLNLPKKITFGTGAQIWYTYDATGVKQAKKVQDGNEVTYTDYIDGFQYVNDELQFIPHTEGYVKHTIDKSGNSHFNYIYQYKDHLGNIRMNYTQNYSGELEIVDESHYYPFGLEHTYYNPDKKEYKQDIDNDDQIAIVQVADREYDYRFNGVELQDELGLNWYTYRHRNYDPAIGRFMCIDPIAEKFPDISTNQFAHNTPVWKIELEGLEGVKFQVFDQNGNFKSHVIQKNVVVLTKSFVEKQSGISEKQSTRIDRKNARIVKNNAARVEKVKNDLNNQYDGATNSKGESVIFDFNVTEMQVDNDFDQSTRGVYDIAMGNGIVSSETAEGGVLSTDDNCKVAPAAIITQEHDGSGGLTSSNYRITVNDSTDGVISHEVGHTLMTKSSSQEHSKNGLMTEYVNDMSKLTKKEVDKMLQDAYEK